MPRSGFACYTVSSLLSRLLMSAALSDRTRRVLAALVREYIETGEPVASATLMHRASWRRSYVPISKRENPLRRRRSRIKRD